MTLFYILRAVKINHLRSGWRDCQAKLLQSAARKRQKKDLIKFSAVLLVLLILGYGMFIWLGGTLSLHNQALPGALSNDDNTNKLSKKDVQAILNEKSMINLEEKSFTVNFNGVEYWFDTSLDMPLQHCMLNQMDLSTSMYIGIVILEPSTGRVLSLVGFDKTNRLNNPCVNNRFPAASVFKIITAAAAIEKHGFKSSSKLTYNGGKYTLYKFQLKDHNNRYTKNITFLDSFAQSVNPVFGKIGINYLGKTSLEKYTDAFCFNRNIDFERPLLPSYVFLSDESYQLAEIACGFNRETKMSPMHGALVSAAIVNQGEMLEPTIIDQIIEETGEPLYQNQLITVNQAITPITSYELKKIMKSTILSGTCRKEFMAYKRGRTLSRLNIGGKTGSISSRKLKDVRYDWFVGFAEEKEGTKKISISVLVAHEKYIGKRASRYARIAIEEYFSNYFSRNDEKYGKNINLAKP